MDYPLETTFDFKFTTRTSAGVPITFAGTPAVEIYEDNGTTQITAAETLTVDFDSITGLHNLRIAATAANGFEAGKNYAAVVSVGTVDGNSVVGEVLLNFSIGRGVAWGATWSQEVADAFRVTPTGTFDTVWDLIGSIVGDTSVLQSDWADGGRLDAILDAKPTLAQILAGGDVDGYSIEETLKLCLAALTGKLSGAAGTTITIRAADDSTDRIVATVDSSGNRTAVTLTEGG